MATARLFLALDPTAELQLRLADCTRTLGPAFGDVRWVRAEATHLTLLFLGDTAAERHEALTTAVSAAVREQPPVPCTVQGIGVFPDRRRPQVVWAGVTAGSEALGRLAARLRNHVREAGFEVEDRPFAAHVTLGRLRPRAQSPRPAALHDALDHWAETDLGRLAGDRVTLYESTLTPAGPRYHALHVWSLTTATTPEEQ